MKKILSASAGGRRKTFGSASNEYFAPESVSEILTLLYKNIHKAGRDPQIIAGGTDILVENHEELYDVNLWIALENIPVLKKIKIKENKIIIGAGVTHTQLEKSKIINKNLPILSQAAADVGSPQIRNRGTIGGNIVTSSPAGDLLPTLLVYQAKFELNSLKSKRRVAAVDFFTGPKDNILRNDELITRIIIPKNQDNGLGYWQKVGKRKALVISSLNIAANIITETEGRIEEGRLALGAVAPVPLLIEEFNEMVKNKKWGELDFQEIAAAVKDKITPIDDLRGTAVYREKVAENLVLKALNSMKNRREGA